MKQKVLITGGGGFLGQYLNSELTSAFKVLSLYHSTPGNAADYQSRKIDLTDTEKVREVFGEFRPDVLVHTAAISNPAKAFASSTADVFTMNVRVTEHLATLCNELNARMIYTSTDLVYAGYRGSLLDENAKLNPVTLYAETKLIGEVKIQNILKDHVILRTALLFGKCYNQVGNFFDTMIRQLRKSEVVDVFTDQYRSPLSLSDAARIIHLVIEKNISGEIINFGGGDRVSRAEFAEIVCKQGHYDVSLLNKITMDQKPDIVPVADVSLNIAKLNSFGMSPHPLDESIAIELEKFNME